MPERRGYLSTHVLDTERGLPAAGVEIELNVLDGGQRLRLCTMQTNADGRTDRPILPSERFETGVYELLFHAGAYLDRVGAPGGAPRFLDVIPIRFGVSDANLHYHVPLLLSAHGYSTYRGS